MQDFIKSIFTKNLITIKADQPLGDAEEKMNNYNIRHLPVIDNDGSIVGMLSKSDYIGLKYVDSRLNNFKVNQVMSSPVISVSQYSQIKEVTSLFIEKKINSALVISGHEAVGIITTENLLKYLLVKLDRDKDSAELDLISLIDRVELSTFTN